MATAPHRSLSIDALYRNGLTVWPGMTIYWIGDQAHQAEVSGHNPDDTPGVKAEMNDADNDPEVRALDFMIGPKFTADKAAALTHALTTGVDRPRLYYVIYDRKIYRRADGFKPEPYTGSDPHTNHVHVSGYAADDENGADWTSVLALEDNMPSERDMQALIWRTKAILDNSPTVEGGPTQGERNKLHDKLATIGGGPGGGTVSGTFTGTVAAADNP